MITAQIVNHIDLIAFWLIFTRMITVMIQLPIFDQMTIPVMVKTLFCVLISYAFFPYLKGAVIADIYAFGGRDSFWILTIFNTCVGLLIGLLVKSIMSLFIAAGSVITQQMGFQAVSYFDPTMNSQVGPFEKIIQWTVLIIILMSGALLPMFKGIFGSFFSISMADLGRIGSSPEMFLRMFKNIFVSALMLASPIIFINMLLTTVLGVIARAVPQMNVLMVSFVVNIGAGLIVFLTNSTEFFNVATKLYVDALGEWFQWVI